MVNSGWHLSNITTELLRDIKPIKQSVTCLRIILQRNQQFLCNKSPNEVSFLLIPFTFPTRCIFMSLCFIYYTLEYSNSKFLSKTNTDYPVQAFVIVANLFERDMKPCTVLRTGTYNLSLFKSNFTAYFFSSVFGLLRNSYFCLYFFSRVND